MSWNPGYALLLVASTALTFLSGLLINRTNSNVENEIKKKFQNKLWITLSFASNLSILFFYKYFDFAVDSMNTVFSSIGIQTLNPAFDVLLPIGISFYTFQALSYTMDVYRGEVPAEKNFARYALFVSFFPLLIAGPIERSKNLLVQVYEKHYFNYDNAKNGLLLMLWGFFQKIVIADRVAVVANTVFDSYQEFGGFFIAVAVIMFAVQIYCDFSAYSDIAFGAAQILGFRATTNFKQPYFATSIQDFWHRWHISLSTWFRDYLYIPLGGSRCSRLKRYRNLIITFIVSGLWHGASWTFVVWGGLHGAFQITGDFIKPYKMKLYEKMKIKTGSPLFRFGQIVVTFTLVSFAWIFFRAPDAASAFGIIHRIFTDFDPRVFFQGFLAPVGLNNRELLIVATAIIMLFIVDYFRSKNDVFERLSSKNIVLRWAVYFVLTASILVFGLYGRIDLQTQFIYFQF